MVEKLNVFEFCSEDAMKAVTSEAPTSTKWVDVRKMKDERRGIHDKQVGGQRLSSSTRGTGQAGLVRGDASKKMPFIMTVAGCAFEKRATKDDQKLMFIDVRKAHLNGVVRSRRSSSCRPSFTPTAVLRGSGVGYWS